MIYSMTGYGKAEKQVANNKKLIVEVRSLNSKSLDLNVRIAPQLRSKELEIRKWLSKSHLYSSAFVVDRNEKGDFILTGAGWGHGVGLCQIGAAVMGEQGFAYDAILQHYFIDATIEKLYE